jgi:hypothetical protein
MMEGEMPEPAASEKPGKAGELAEAAIVFLNHLEDTLDDANFDAVSVKLWNRLSSLASEVRDASRPTPVTEN